MTEPTVDVTVTLPVELVRRAQDAGDAIQRITWYRETAAISAPTDPVASSCKSFMAALIETPLPEPVREVVVGCLVLTLGGVMAKVLCLDDELAWCVTTNNTIDLLHFARPVADLTFVRDGSTDG